MLKAGCVFVIVNPPGRRPGEQVRYTNDLFRMDRMDEEGYFYFVGRQDDIIKSRAEVKRFHQSKWKRCFMGC